MGTRSPAALKACMHAAANVTGFFVPTDRQRVCEIVCIFLCDTSSRKMEENRENQKSYEQK